MSVLVENGMRETCGSIVETHVAICMHVRATPATNTNSSEPARRWSHPTLDQAMALPMLQHTEVAPQPAASHPVPSFQSVEKVLS